MKINHHFDSVTWLFAPSESRKTDNIFHIMPDLWVTISFKCTDKRTFQGTIQSLNRSVQLFDGSMTADWLIVDGSITDDRWPIWAQFYYVKWRMIGSYKIKNFHWNEFSFFFQIENASLSDIYCQIDVFFYECFWFSNFARLLHILTLYSAFWKYCFLCITGYVLQMF